MPDKSITRAAPGQPAQAALRQLREQVLTAILVANAFLAMISLLWLLWSRTPNLYYYLAGFTVLLTITVFRRFGYTVRATVLLALLFVFGLSEYWKDAYTSSGNIAFMAMIILAGLFFGLRSGLLAAGIGFATLMAVAWKTVQDPGHVRPEIRAVSDFSSGWVDNGLDLLIIGIPILVVFVFLIRRLTGLIDDLHQEMAEREEASHALAKSEQQYRLLAENVKDVVYLLNMNLEFEYCSPSVLQLMGYTPAEVQAMPVAELFTPDSFRMILEMFAEELQNESEGMGNKDDQRIVEYEVVCKDGSTKWIESGVVFVRNAHGEPVKILGVNRDIAERKRAEAERVTLHNKLQEMQKLESLGLLAGGIAHDFNNILMGILGNTDLALERCKDDAELRATLEQVVVSAQRASDLCGQLLAYSGRGKFIVQPVDLAELLQEMSGLINLSVEKSITLNFDFEPALPAVEVDVTRLRQAIMNLVVNASEAIGKPGGTITIAVQSVFLDTADRMRVISGEHIENGQYLRISVSDTGCGMDAEIRSRIFDPFFSTKESGHGLGLAALLGFVRSHAGGLEVTSAPGQGATITLWLPASEKAPVSVVKPRMPAGAYTGSGLILMVDDEELILRVGRRALEKRGFEVITAASGEEAVEIYRKDHERIRMVILDMTMPGMSGIETLRALRTINPNIRAVLSSGYSKTSALNEGSEPGLAGFLQKPYRLDDFVETVRRALEADH